ncbi:UNVERIFIED_CONTAM: hypothetical protein Sindi_0929400, partial [Sesamum indicum]
MWLRPSNINSGGDSKTNSHFGHIFFSTSIAEGPTRLWLNLPTLSLPIGNIFVILGEKQNLTSFGVLEKGKSHSGLTIGWERKHFGSLLVKKTTPHLRSTTSRKTKLGTREERQFLPSMSSSEKRLTLCRGVWSLDITAHAISYQPIPKASGVSDYSYLPGRKYGGRSLGKPRLYNQISQSSLGMNYMDSSR